MKEKIKKFTGNEYLVLLLTLFKIWDIVKPLFYSSYGNADLSHYYRNYDWVGFGIQIITIALLFFVYKQYLKLRNEFIAKTDQLNEDIHVSSAISLHRTKRSIRKQTERLKGFGVGTQNEQRDDQFLADIKEEYEEVKNLFIHAMPEKSLNEIKSMLTRYYPSVFSSTN